MIGEGAEGAAYDDMIDARYDAAKDNDSSEKRHVQKELQFECCKVQSDDQFTHDDSSRSDPGSKVASNTELPMLQVTDARKCNIPTYPNFFNSRGTNKIK